MNNIDFEKLRSHLYDYYGSAMFSGFPMAIVDLTDVENASEEELIAIAKRAGFNLNDYIDYSKEEPKDQTFKKRF